MTKDDRCNIKMNCFDVEDNGCFNKVFFVKRNEGNIEVFSFKLSLTGELYLRSSNSTRTSCTPTMSLLCQQSLLSYRCAAVVDTSKT